MIVAFGGCGGEKDQVSGGIAGGDTDEEIGNQTASL